MMTGSRATQRKAEQGTEQAGRGGGRPLAPNLAGPHARLLALQQAAGNRAVSAQMHPDFPDRVQDLLRSPGRPLDPAIRAEMETKFGRDFGDVRLHTNAAAQAAAQALHARAFTRGRDIAFGADRYAPETAAGEQLLAHELAHVAQAGNGAARFTTNVAHISPTADPAEREARAAADAVQTGRPVPLLAQAAVPATIYRNDDAEKTATKKETAEERRRAAILSDMTRETAFPKKLRQRIASATNAFTLAQLRQMQRAGVRFWGRSGLPPDFTGVVQRKALASPGEYLRETRVIRLSERATTSQIRHELAHAWDHVRAMTKPKRIKGRKAMEKAVVSPGAFWSASSRKRATREPAKGGKSKRARLTMKEMFERYKGRAKLREWTFDGPSTREGHSKVNPQEFYAEGYSVFHGVDPASQMRLRLFAPELYQLLKSEALKNKQPVPDEAELDTLEKEFGFSK
jgi:hypothetical protein